MIQEIIKKFKYDDRLKNKEGRVRKKKNLKE